MKMISNIKTKSKYPLKLKCEPQKAVKQIGKAEVIIVPLYGK